MRIATTVVTLYIFSKDGCFYSPGNEYEFHQLEAWDLSDHSCPKDQLIDPTFSSPQTIQEMKDYQSSHRQICYFVKHLVESSGDLLLVIRFFILESVSEEDQFEDLYDKPMFHRTLRLDVHKLNFDLNKWEPVACLNDRALFVGYNHSFSLSTRDYPELSENSIYFTEYSEEEGIYPNTGHDNGVFHLEDKSITYYCTHDWKLIELHSFWVPSPVWVCVAQNSASW
ncbi:uncharacterized protein LOC132314064 [Cornus florida]|uniref:uncharacterized protein LOC132314064 n=1 Tax=Cornus florida TaxID=4283 RepID=UPI00289AF835|nr:uncharacterized protein LOC132314064 [Cornus florida]